MILRFPIGQLLRRFSFAAAILFNSVATHLEPHSCSGQEPTKTLDRFDFQGEWTDLFDDQTLRGWVQRGGKAKFRADEQSIIGTTVRGEPNSYLCTEREFENFELAMEFMVDDPRINSGVQFRSQSLSEYRDGQVHGYQVEIDPSERGWTGALYDDNRRGWLFKPESQKESIRKIKVGQWNQLKVVCQGDSLKTWLNEESVADLKDDVTRKGFIALQIHSTEVAKPLSIRWRKLRIRELQ